MCYHYKRFWAAGQIYNTTNTHNLSENDLLDIIRYLDVEKKMIVFKYSLINGYDQVIQLLLPQIPFTLQEAVYIACMYGYTKVVEILLDDSATDESLFNFAFCEASKHGHFEIVKLLLKDTRFEITYVTLNKSIRKASKYGYYTIVELLLLELDTRFELDLNDLFNYVLYSSINTKIFRLFLSDPRLDPSYDNNIAIR